ncbi:hypothetical protein ACRAWD_22485 [Caulobacter segnis]
MKIFRAAGWDLPAVDEAQRVIDRIPEKHYPAGGTILGSMVARLPPGRRIARHTDGHPSFSVAHRDPRAPGHANSGVEFIVGDERFAAARAHYAFELNNLVARSVTSRGRDRAYPLHLRGRAPTMLVPA